MTMLADIRDYFMFLTLDGLKDHQLAEQLVNRFCALQAWLGTFEITQTLQHQHVETAQFYVGFLFTMEELLSLRYEITMLPNEMISREDFKKSWIHTARKLNLPDNVRAKNNSTCEKAPEGRKSVKFTKRKPEEERNGL